MEEVFGEFFSSTSDNTNTMLKKDLKPELWTSNKILQELQGLVQSGLEAQWSKS